MLLDVIRVEEVVIDAVRVGGAFGCGSSREVLSDVIRVEVIIDAIRVRGAFGRDLSRGGSYRRSSSRGGAFGRDSSRGGSYRRGSSRRCFRM